MTIDRESATRTLNQRANCSKRISTTSSFRVAIGTTQMPARFLRGSLFPDAVALNSISPRAGRRRTHLRPRNIFEPTDSVYLRFQIRFSKGWRWTGRSYHPHLLHFMTTENPKFHGPAASHLTLYIEPQEGKLRLAAQDIQNKDSPHGLTQGPLRGGYNGKFYDSERPVFVDDKWHRVEAFFRLNTLDTAKDLPNADGIARGWFDGKLVVDRTDVIFRSTDFPHMKFNQFLMAPYFGPGLLPGDQTLWIDEMLVATAPINSE